MWEKSFVAVSVLLGSSVDDATAMLTDASLAAAADLTEKLRDPRRAARAQALARAAHEIAVAVDEVTLR